MIFGFHLLLWRVVCGEGNIYSGKITLTSAGPLRENQQKPEGGRKSLKGRAVPKLTGKVDHMAPIWSIKSFK